VDNPASDSLEYLKVALGRDPVCLPLPELTGMLYHRDDPDLRHLAEAHVAKCVHCQLELRLSQEFESAVASPAEAEAVHWMAARLSRHVQRLGQAKPLLATHRGTSSAWRKGGLTLRFLGAASAFAGLLILISAGLYMRGPMEPQVLFRAQGADVPRAAKVIALSPGGDLPEAPSALEWHAFSNAASYRVRLMEVDRAELWHADVMGTDARLPKEVMARMLEGKTMLWDVTAKGATGTDIASSGIQRFRVMPQSTR